MVNPKSFMVIASVLASPLAGAQTSTTTDPATQAAQDQATIATSNATAQYAQATAQQALLAAQLANQKTELGNLQAATSGFDPSKTRVTGPSAAVGVNALFMRIMSQQVDRWLAPPATPDAGGQKGSQDKKPTDDASSSRPRSPIDDLDASCGAVVLNKPSLPATLMNFKAVQGRLSGDYTNIVIAKNAYDDSVKPAPVGLPGNGHLHNLFIAPVVPLVASLVTFGLDALSAAKPGVTAGTFSSQPTVSSIVLASIEKRITTNNHLPAGPAVHAHALYDPDASLGLQLSAPSPSCTVFDGSSLNASVDDVSLVDLASCTKAVIENDRAFAARQVLSPKPTDPKAKDKESVPRAKLDALTAAIVQATADYAALFSADASGRPPMSAALQGEVLSKALKTPNACVLSVTTPSADADTVAIDGVLTKYTLSVETTVTIAWTIASPDGSIQRAGTTALATDWTKQDLKRW